ncbi:hypothetical protein C6Y14_14685 [Streptomyces dioscori]|uniref:Uncharacterized protein n=1 Tax=Streptomyces dioscori TaxID=2109333 RepID=A0A2P8Q884_9ACTN|nr:hypothetical protein C6Y14_14685 [Streptomyces dioscori]
MQDVLLALPGFGAAGDAGPVTGPASGSAYRLVSHPLTIRSAAGLTNDLAWASRMVTQTTY